jgi:hypothetical protein
MNLRLALGLCSLFFLAPQNAWAGEAFGPFDAGAKRSVHRQGKKGTDRAAHPFVGHVGKIPAEGPLPAPLRRDPDLPEMNLAAANRVGGSLSSNPLYLFALTYRHFITKMDGARCHHYPTCSRFANQAVAKHGLLGIPMGLDRLLQTGESSALRWLPEVEVLGSRRFFDPLENYEFWKPSAFSAFPDPVPEEGLALPPLPSPDLAAKGSH